MVRMNKARRVRGFTCDYCHNPMKAGHELILNDSVWEDLCKRAESPWPPEYTLLCPECIVKLLQRPLAIEDLIVEWKSGKGCIGAVPMNLWYYRKSGMMSKALPYIKAHILSHPAARDAWKDLGVVLVRD